MWKKQMPGSYNTKQTENPHFHCNSLSQTV